MSESTAELEVVCGTYEAFVVGYQLNSARSSFREDSDCDHSTEQYGQFSFVNSFADHAHTSSVRCVDCDGDIVASGGTDELIKVFNMHSRREVGHITHHSATVTAVCVFADGRRLLSGDADGNLMMTGVGGGCPLIRRLVTPRSGSSVGGITALSVHPSGRMALSCAAGQRELITWDIRGGRVVFRTALASSAEFLVWSPEGSVFAVGVSGACDVYSVATGSTICEAVRPGSRRVMCAVFVSETVIFVADETGDGILTDISRHAAGATSDGDEEGVSVRWRVMDGRVRSARAVRRSDHISWLVCVTSTGHIAVWSVDMGGHDHTGLCQPDLVARYDTRCRLTSVAVHVPSQKRYQESGAAQEAVCDDCDAADSDADEKSVPAKSHAQKTGKKRKKMLTATEDDIVSSEKSPKESVKNSSAKKSVSSGSLRRKKCRKLPSKTRH